MLFAAFLFDPCVRVQEERARLRIRKNPAIWFGTEEAIERVLGAEPVAREHRVDGY